MHTTFARIFAGTDHASQIHRGTREPLTRPFVLNTSTTLRKIAFVVILAGTLAGGSATGFAQPTPDGGSGQSLEGAWNVTIEFDPSLGLVGCTTPSLNTRDGGVVAHGCSLAESPGYGQWVRTGNRKFGVTFVGLGFDLVTGGIANTYKVRATVRLRQDRQQFRGPFVTDIFALDGTLLFTATGTVRADRITVEPLP